MPITDREIETARAKVIAQADAFVTMAAPFFEKYFVAIPPSARSMFSSLREKTSELNDLCRQAAQERNRHA